MVSTTPAFNLKVVLKETGLAADTLRAWERRYGLPVPQRTRGGHRLYSQRDIETIKWLMKRQTEGLSISRAVDMWNEQLAAGSDPLADLIDSLLASASPVLSQNRTPDTTLDLLRSQWVEACIEFNESKAEQTLNQAFSMFPVEVVCLDVLQRGLSEIGDLWQENQVSVQQEHFASGLAMRRLDALLISTPPPTRNQILLIGCPPGEWHVFTPLLFALFLRRRGFPLIYLGGNVPAPRFADTVKNVKADLVILIAQQLVTAATLQETVFLLAKQKISVAFGGRIFNVQPEITNSISGYFLGTELIAALDEIELILRSKATHRQQKTASQEYITAHQSFTSKRTQIELTLKETLEPNSISPEDVKTGIHFLGDNITAALQLGDMSYVSAEVDWLKNLLQAYETPSQQLIHFMKTYARSLDQAMDGQGKPIFEWFAAEIQKLDNDGLVEDY
ncbi:MAG TPA: B12-binding domain-containing protein [Anaerolineales bacterium]|nr:B12-binding domain-containing protein [Anaerolineales bacterium]